MPSSLEQTLVGLLPVVIGGVLAALGGVLGALIGHRLSLSRELRTKEREKLEQIATVAFEFSAWHERRISALLFQNTDFREQSLTDKLRMLVNLYYPALRPEMTAVLEAGLKCQSWVNEAWAEQKKDLKAWLDKPDNMKDYYPLAKDLIVKTDALVESVRNLLPK